MLSFPLSKAQPGDIVWIVGITASDALRQRLISMGLSRGTEIRVITSGSGGALMIAISNTRLALNTDMANLVHVCESPYSPIDSPQDLMAPQLHLRDIGTGSTGRITGYEQGARAYRQQLLAMGLTPGTEFTVIRHAPLGDPVELKVRGFQLSLRKAEADALIVEAINDD